MLDVPFRGATQLATSIRRKKIGCLELLELYLGRVEKYNPALNAIVVRDAERARSRARAADRALARGEIWGPLHGVPMTIKESYDVAGLPTTWGVPDLKNNVATTNAVVVDRLLGAGVVLFGKTNVPLYLADWQSFNAIYGTTNNPWDLSRAPGGSSGGSAAALAAGLTGLEAGSDIGSSIRNPAHFCGVFGHKPTWGIVPRTGQALPGQIAPVDIDVVGPLARSVEDLSLALSIVAGPDPIDAAGWRLHLRAPRQKRLRDYTVALLLEVPESEVDREVKERLLALADFLRRQNVRVDEGARPAIDTAEAFRVYVRLLRAATSSRQRETEFAANLELARQLRSDDDSYYARALRASVLSHRDWLAADEARHRMRLAWADFFTKYDLLSARWQGRRPSHTTMKASAINGHSWSTASAAGNRPSVLGGLQRRVLSSLDGGPLWIHRCRAPGGCSDCGASVWRPGLPDLRGTPRTRVPSLRAAKRLRVRAVFASWPSASR